MSRKSATVVPHHKDNNSNSKSNSDSDNDNDKSSKTNNNEKEEFVAPLKSSIFSFSNPFFKNSSIPEDSLSKKTASSFLSNNRDERSHLRRGAHHERLSSDSFRMTTRVKSSREWEVRLPPPQRLNVGGRYVPNFPFQRYKRRKIIVEILEPRTMTITPKKEQPQRNRTKFPRNNKKKIDPVVEPEPTYEKGNPVMLNLLSGKRELIDEAFVTVGPDEKVVMRVLKPQRKWQKQRQRQRRSSITSSFWDGSESSDGDGYGNGNANGNDTDNESNASSRAADSISSLGLLGVSDEPDETIWVERNCCYIDEVKLVSRVGKCAVMILPTNQNNENRHQEEQRHVFFNSGVESRHFFKHVLNCQEPVCQDS